MSLTPTAVSGTTKFALIGDSVTSTFGNGVPWISGWQAQMRAQYNQTTITPGSSIMRMPTWTSVNAAAGRAVGSISPTIATFLLAIPKMATTDVLIIQLGINDADNIKLGAAPTTDLATFTAQCNTVLAAYDAMSPKPQLMWIGPWAHDTNDDLTQIAQVDNVLGNVTTGLVATRNGNYVQWSTIVNTGGNSTADGTHPTAQGGLALAAKVHASCTFTP